MLGVLDLIDNSSGYLERCHCGNVEAREDRYRFRTKQPGNVEPLIRVHSSRLPILVILIYECIWYIRLTPPMHQSKERNEPLALT